MEKPSLFISHVNEDKAVANMLAMHIERAFSRAIQVFVSSDGSSILLGDKWLEKIENALRNASIVIVLASADSVGRPWVNFEAGGGWIRGARVMPVCVRGMQIGSLPEPLKSLQACEINTREGIERFFRGLGTVLDLECNYTEWGTLLDLLEHLSKSPRQADVSAPPQRPPNRKPLTFGDFTEDQAYLMFGEYTSPIDIRCVYHHEHLVLDDDLGKIYHYLADQAKQKAERKGVPYFNGPNTRLLRFNDVTAQDTERKAVELHLGPVSWEEFTVLNNNFDVQLPSSGTETIRSKYARPESVYNNDRDFSWCKLSNILVVTCTPITSDGFGLVQVRNPHGVSTGGESDNGPMHTVGINENIHRYLDEIDLANGSHEPLHGWEPPHKLAADRKKRVNDTYKVPAGHTLDVYVTARRGMFEEISKKLFEMVPVSSYRFLNIIYDLYRFQPALGGVVVLNYTWREVERMIKDFPAPDHSERLEIKPVNLKSETDVLDILRKNWLVHGRAAFITAANYWRAHGEK